MSDEREHDKPIKSTKPTEEREWAPTDRERHERALHEAQQSDKSQRDRDPRMMRPDRSRERRPL
jgi:hypothetical protein